MCMGEHIRAFSFLLLPVINRIIAWGASTPWRTSTPSLGGTATCLLLSLNLLQIVLLLICSYSAFTTFISCTSPTRLLLKQMQPAGAHLVCFCSSSFLWETTMAEISSKVVWSLAACQWPSFGVHFVEPREVCFFFFPVHLQGQVISGSLIWLWQTWISSRKNSGKRAVPPEVREGSGFPHHRGKPWGDIGRGRGQQGEQEVSLESLRSLLNHPCHAVE